MLLFSCFQQVYLAQYCTPAPLFGCLTGDYPSAFSMTGTSMSINDPSLTCSTGSGGFGGYEDRTAETCAVASPSTVNCSISSNIASTSVGYSTSSPTPSGFASTPTYHAPIHESCELWVDWDGSGTFGDSPGEVIGGMEPLPNSPLSFTVSIPSGIATGYYRMRLVVSQSAAYNSATMSGMDPCMTGFPFPYSTGDAIDYTIYVGPSCTAPTLTLGTATYTSQVINWSAVSGVTG